MLRALARKKTVSPVAEHFQAYLDFAVESPRPFSHWLAENILPDDVLNDIVALPAPLSENHVYDGTRESNPSRFYFTPEQQEKHYICREIASIFHDPSVVKALEAVTSANLAHGHLHIEYCQETDGFWLDAQTGEPESFLKMEIVLSDDPALRNAGTDLYDASYSPVVRTPHDKGTALIFVPAKNSWHGFSRRPVNGVRKSLIVNYYSPEWKKTDELA